MTVTAAPQPIVTTGTATNILPTSAQLNGVVNPNGVTTSAFFEYGLTTAYGTSTGGNPIGSGTADVPQTFIATNLACNTTYHFRMSAFTNTTTVNGADASFTTGACPLAKPGDFTGDGQADLAVYRPGSGIWSVQGAGDVQWGLPGDVPVAGDYNNNGMVDIAVYRPSTGTWFIRNQTSVAVGPAGRHSGAGGLRRRRRHRRGGLSSSPTARGTSAVSSPGRWGVRGDMPIPADFDGDGKADLAVFRPSGGAWFIAYSSTGFTHDGSLHLG